MHKVALLPGDGIGPEITDAAIRVIESAGVAIDWVPLEAGLDARRKRGTPIPDNHTPDLGGNATTKKLTGAIIDDMSKA